MPERVHATVSKPVKDWLAVKRLELDLSESAAVSEILKEAMRRDRKPPRQPMPSSD